MQINIKRRIVKGNIGCEIKRRGDIMSNHSGSYMLNDVLDTAKDMGIFEAIGKEKTREFVLKMIEIGEKNDCNDGEILEGIGEELGMCYCCLKETNDMEHGLCRECRE